MENYFSVPIFLVTLRETIELSMIVSVLLSLIESLVSADSKPEHATTSVGLDRVEEMESGETRRIVRRMRWMIWGGALMGLLIASTIGAAFVAVFFTTLNDLSANLEECLEGVFSLITCVMITKTALNMLRIDQSKIKWHSNLFFALNTSNLLIGPSLSKSEAKSGKWTLFLLSLTAVLRQTLKAVVFVGGASLGHSAKLISLAVIWGVIGGFVVGYLIYVSGSRVNLSIFLVISTQVLLLLGAGLFSEAVRDFELYGSNQSFQGDERSTDRPYLTLLPSAIFSWTNNATPASLLSYCLYWIIAIVVLVYMKWEEGRTSLFGVKSDAGKRRKARQAIYLDEKVESTWVEKSREVDVKSDSEKKLEVPQARARLPPPGRGIASHIQTPRLTVYHTVPPVASRGVH
ncbi:uncharacterized protein JCM6883_006376 [Sporobolomyces salmoneus]|uniref:uncharacterized protein n=1 Tax=Sporobolomyces salmoneus TaxID=183962 RepID=UPI003181A5D5